MSGVRTLLHDQLGFHHLAIGVDTDALDAGYTGQYVGCQQDQQPLVVVVHGGQHPVADDLAALLVALAACSSVDVVEILEKKRLEVTLLEVTITGEQDPDPPWTYRKIHVKYRLGGKDLTEKAVEQAIRLSLDKYCSVASTVRGVAQITTEHEIVA